MKEIGYTRRKSHKKGFLEDLRVMAERLAFAEEGILWSRERVQKQMYTGEVWAMGGAHTNSWVTVRADGSDWYLAKCLAHKYSKAPA